MKKECNRIKPKEEIVLDYIVHLFILVIVLCTIFFAFISKIERKNLINALTGEIKQTIEETPIAPDPVTGEELKKIAKLFTDGNDADTYYNQGLVNVSISIIICLGIALLAVYWTMKLSAHKCPPIWSIIAKNLLLFSLVGIVEYLFFVNIAEKYVPVKPSYISELIDKRI